MVMDYEQVMRELKSLRNPVSVRGMARYGINPNSNFGVSVRQLRSIASEIGRDHLLAQRLWSSGIHDARILASMVDDPEAVTEQQMESWVRDFDSWDVCDEVCNNLFSATRFARQKAIEWSRKSEEFIKRAGFVLMVGLAVHDKAMETKEFLRFLKIVESETSDARNYVKKAVNWALRQIGKRSLQLNRAAIQTARVILKADSKNAEWIASDALRELTSEKIKERLHRKDQRIHKATHAQSPVS
jgi:3-methyladenine DNA glycosylase AlkD